jgi:hypothetical protein
VNDVRYYGARCDGVTNDAVALQAAFNSQLQRTVTGAGLRCKSNSALTLPAGKTLSDIVLDFTGMPVIGVSSSTYLTLTAGSQGTTSLLATTLNANEWRVALATPIASLAAGDYVYLASTQVYATDGSTTFGQLALVNYVSTDGLTVDLADGVFLPYSTAFGATMRRILFNVGTTLENVELIGNATGLTTESVRGILAVRSRNLLITNVSISQVYTQGINIQTSWNARVQNSFVVNATRDGTAYGIAITNGCAYVKISNCHFENVRHGVTTGTGSVGGINYQIEYIGNSAYGVRDAGFDMHPQTYSGLIVGNLVTFEKGRPISGNSDGIVFQGATGVVSNNVVLGGSANDVTASRTGIYVQPLVLPVIEPQNIVIQGNVVQFASTGIILLAQGGAGSSLSSVSIVGNTVSDFSAIGISVQSSTQNIRSLSMASNSLYTSRAISSSSSIQVRVSTGVTIQAVSIVGNAMTGTNSSVLRGVQIVCDAGSVLSAITTTSNSFTDLFIGINFSGANLIPVSSLGGNIFSNAATRVAYSSSIRPVAERFGITGTLVNEANQVLSLGSSTALSTSATVGYVGITSCAGAPTGVPAGAALGTMPIHYDSTNNRLYVYNGAWRSVLLA